MRAPILFAGILVWLMAACPPLRAATITVNSTNDPAGFNTNITVATLGSTVTLRDAVIAANNTPGDDAIVFDSSLNGLTIALIQSDSTMDAYSSPRNNGGPTALRITSNMEFIAPAGGLVVRASGLIRLFDIAPGATVRVERLTLRGGVANNGGGFWNAGALTLDEVTMTSFVASSLFISNTNDLGYGACVFNAGNLVARSSYFAFNNGQSSGGAFFNTASASLHVTNCIFESNSSEFSGPAIGTESTNGLARITHSVFKGNRVEFSGNWPVPAIYAGGGALLNAGALSVAASTFQSNTVLTAQWGGAIQNRGTLAIADSTFEGNSAGGAFARGGALFSDGTLGLTNCTFTGNSARYGSAVDNQFGVMMRMVNCTIARNVQTLPETFALDVGNALVNVLENNLVVENDRWDASVTNFVPANLVGALSTTGTNFVGNTNVLLGVLATNSGPVKTMALPAGSPAVNAGFAVAGLSTDARGQPRYEAPDLGAYELPTYAPVFTSPSSTIFLIGQSNSFQFTANSGLPFSFAPVTPLPAGITLTPAGLLSGNPSAPSGLYPVLVRAFNAYNFTDLNFLIIVNDGTLADRYSWQLNGGADLTNGTFTLTDGGIGQSRSAWYLFKQDINAFQASFEYVDVGGGGADGVAFVLQNAPAGVTALGGGGGGLGYLGISPSFALLINVYASAPGGPGIQISTGGSGLGTNAYLATPAANPASGDPIRFDLYYLNGVLNVTMTNLASNTTFSTNFVVDIPGAVLGNQAWIGFTGATGGSTATQRVSNFFYASLSATATVVVTDASDPAGFNTNIIFSMLGTNITLRDAVNAANNYPGPSVIRFAPHLAGTNIALQQVGDNSNGSTALPIRRDVTIENTTTGTLTISRGIGGDLRLFRVFSGAALTLRDLRLSGGRVSPSDQHGGLAHNAGTLVVERCMLSGGYSGRGGGGLYNNGTLVVVSSAIVSNTSVIGQGFGAGGGGIMNQGTMALTNCTVAYNTAPNAYGGGVWNTAGSMSFDACTFAFNSAFALGSSIGSFGQKNALVRNCIVADVSDITLLAGSVSNLFYNPGLGTFGFNGGPTPTFPITATSAAHKAGAVLPGLITDQRGVARHAIPDIGAYELIPRDALIVSTTVDENDGNADNEQGTGTSLREALIYAQTLGGPQTITFAPALAGQTVVLDTGWTNASDASALRVTGAITLNGLASAPGITLAVAPGASKRHFYIEPGAQLTLQDLTLTGGYGADYGGSIWNYFGSLTVRRCTFTGNIAANEGGAIQTWGGSPLLVIENATFAGNTSSNLASAIGTGALSNSFKHVTITANNSPNGSLWLYNTVVPLQNSIVAGNASDGVVTFGSGAFSPDSFGNVLGTGNTAGLSNGVNANVTGLAPSALFLDGLSSTNGGPTPTVALLPNSPAFNRGSNLVGIATDQRGSSRISLGAPDAGAFELVATESSLVTTTNDEFDATSDPRFGTGTSLREALYHTTDFVGFSTNLTGQTVELTLVGDTAFGNTAILLTNQSVRFIRSTQTPRVTIRVNGPETMRHFRIVPGTSIVLQGITLTGGQATNGGSVYNQGVLSLSFATLASNAASGSGGAVFVDSNAALRVISSTLSDNAAGVAGGAVANRGTNWFQYSTIAGNRADGAGGGLFNDTGAAPSTLESSIVAGNTDNLGAPSNIGGPVSVNGASSYNLIGAGGSGGLVHGVNSNRVGIVDPGLAPLADYGGRTPTRAVYPWSPAVDGSLLAGGEQRGYARSNPYDIGAFEIQRSTNDVTLANLVRSPTGGPADTLVVDFPGGVTGATFSVYATTNLFTPTSQWQWIGLVPETPPGSSLFRATLPIATNAPSRYFRVQSP